ncbi:MAG: EI24 domain-containing protein [Syntrophobacteraceae bacterium]|nr:EI24 domain-containing protein [Syntrophobacteraceae bacterium]
MIQGIIYNFRGLWLGIRTPRLLVLGLLRFVITAALAVVITGLVLAYHAELAGFLWAKPQGSWLVWLWHVFSWLLTLGLVAVSSLLSYLAGQILFGAVIMDVMSRVVEGMLTGRVAQPDSASIWAQMVYITLQEVPRTILPMLASSFIMVLGWLTPLGPVITILSLLLSAILLAWDSTDIIPARRMIPFRERFRALKGSLLFHLGFGLCFFIPIANILFLAFAPVGAALHHFERGPGKTEPSAAQAKTP